MSGLSGDGFTLRFFNLHLSLLYVFSNLIYVLLLFIILMSVVYLGGEITEILLFFGIFLCVFFFLSLSSVYCSLSDVQLLTFLPPCLSVCSSNMFITSYLKPIVADILWEVSIFQIAER